MVVEGDRSRRNRLFFILLDFNLSIIVVLMQIANFCKQNYLAMLILKQLQEPFSGRMAKTLPEI
jgi:hypothetical protein